MRTSRSLKASKLVVTHEHDAWALFFTHFWRGIALGLLFLLAVGLGLAARLGYWGYGYLNTVSKEAGMSLSQILSVAKTGWNQPVKQTDNRVNFLVLGIDTLGNRSSDQIMTDTIMVLSLNTTNGVVTSFSVPRDLYIASAKVKINGIYQQAKTAGNPQPQAATTQAIESLTGIPIHYTVMLEINEIGKVIDAIGGLDVAVERSFTDTRFPREDVDVSAVTDPTKLYKTVEFIQGTEHMDGQRATEFIRSRHSTDPLEGSDDGRVRRQQQVIAALIHKLEDKQIVKQPVYVGLLLKVYREDINQFVPMTDAVAIGRQFIKLAKAPTMRSFQMPVKDFAPDPVLYHPARFPTGAWVYLPVDSSGKQIKDLVSSWLK